MGGSEAPFKGPHLPPVRAPPPSTITTPSHHLHHPPRYIIKSLQSQPPFCIEAATEAKTSSALDNT
jgi:hypothetical protein